jgi:hypothetical protein
MTCKLLLVVAPFTLLRDVSAAEEALSVLFSETAADNIVTSNSTAIQAAEKAGYRLSNDGNGVVFNIPGSTGSVELKTFFKESIADTLTVASEAGLAYAKSNNYTFVRSEGFGWVDAASCNAAPPTDSPCLPMLQYYSTNRNDNFLAVTASHVSAATYSKYKLLRTEGYCKGNLSPPTPSPTLPPPTPPPTVPTKEWLAWPQPSKGDPQVADCPFPKSIDLTGFEYLNTMAADPSAETPSVGGDGRSADTWYPTASMDGKLYTPWTDGTVHGVHSSSSGAAATTGTAIVSLPPDFDPVRDVFNLAVENVSTFAANSAPYQGRYPCGSLFYKGIWW